MGLEKLRASLQKVFPKKDFNTQDIPKFNKIPEDYELSHYKELERRNEVKKELQDYRDANKILSPRASAKTVFKSVIRESQVMTPEEKLLYEDVEPRAKLKIKGSNKKLSNRQIKSLLKKLNKSRFKQAGLKGKAIQKLTGLFLPQPKVYKGTSVS